MIRLVVLFMLVAVPGIQAQEVTVGDPAPLFSLPYATRDSIMRSPLNLADFVGKENVILAFYPADWSPGCTKEVCTLRDDFAALQSLRATVVGISGDYTWSHHEWAKHHDLPFLLASDHLHQTAKVYGSYNEKTNFNRRTVFLIDKHGKVAYLDREYSVADLQDFERLKTALRSLP